MIAWEVTRRAVAIAGQVTDAMTGAPLAGAVVEIVQGPEPFEARRATLARDPDWERQAERLDRAVSRADGSYYFIGLPPGKYRLHVSVPGLGSRYGAVTLEAVEVAARKPDERIRPAPADAKLPPTRIHGRVTRKDNGQPIAGAKVQLLGDSRIVLTGDDGQYVLADLVQGNPTVKVSTNNKFETVSLTPSLTPGQDRIVDVALA